MNYQVTCICGGYGFPISASAARIIMVGRALQEAGIPFQVLHCGTSPMTLNNQSSGVYAGIPFQYTTVVKRPENKIIRSLVYLWGFVALAVRLAKLWPVRRSTVIYLYMMDGPLNLCAGALCRLLGLPIVQEMCEWFPSRADFSRFNKWLYRSWIFRAATGVLAISRAIEARVAEGCRDTRSELILHRVGVMVDAATFANASALAGEAGKQRPSFVWCGTWMNDVYFLIRAFALLRAEGYEGQLIIIGECGERSGPAILEFGKQQGLTGDDLILTGCVDERTLKGYYKSAAALLAPLWRDDASITRLPNKVGEYLAAGRPVITCGIGDLTDFLIDDCNAYVAEPGNERDFAERMIRVVQRPERAKEIGGAGQQTCFALLDYRAHAGGLAEFFARCRERYNKRRQPNAMRSERPQTDAGTKLRGHAPTDLHTVQVLGSRVHLISTAETVDRMEQWIKSREEGCRRVIVSGFHGLLLADKDRNLHAVLNGAELWAPDGIAPVLVARLNGHRGVGRATGVDIMREFFRRADERGYSSYFYGDTEVTLNALSERVRREHPGHRIAGMYAPPFRALTPDEDAEIIERINAARPDILWVALGMPKQDVWIYDRLARLQVPVAIGVGAAFAFVAGTVPRCPEWMGRMGFEWAYRFIKEPKKLWRRDLIGGSAFLLRLGLDAAGRRKTTG